VQQADFWRGSNIPDRGFVIDRLRIFRYTGERVEPNAQARQDS